MPNEVVMMTTTECECGQVYGARCHLRAFDASRALMVEWYPADVRAHVRALPEVERVIYAQHLIVAPRCALRLIDTEGDHLAVLPGHFAAAALGVPNRGEHVG